MGETDDAPTFRATVVGWRDEGGIVLDDVTPVGAEYPAVGEEVTVVRHQHSQPADDATAAEPSA
jgi:hypothetical protein